MNGEIMMQQSELSLMHIEITDRCPLNCPQCYTHINDGNDMPYDLMEKYIVEAHHYGLKVIALSGGEPLLYPDLIKVIKKIKALGMACVMATSGYHMDKAMISKLKASGIDEVFLSLNGSCAEVHHQSRDKFEETLDALIALSTSTLKYGINWVARKDNIKDFPNMIKLAKTYGVEHIAILAHKPERNHAFDAYPDILDLIELSKIAKEERDVLMTFEACFTRLNFARGQQSLCGAGKKMVAIDVNGRFNPCRHLNFSEEFDSLASYYEHSNPLNDVINDKSYHGKACEKCEVNHSCHVCKAIVYKTTEGFTECAYKNLYQVLNGILFKQHKETPL